MAQSSITLKMQYTSKQLNNSYNHPQSLELIEQYIQPETALERAIIQDDSWIEGAFWGEPRSGHPEGKVLYHIREVLDNVDAATTDPALRRDLRLITIIHDTFKYQEELVRPRTDWQRHHAVFARNFAAQFITQEYLLNIIEFHDEAFYAWLYLQRGNEEKSARRLRKLFSRVEPQHWQLFYLFFKCDTQTGDKTQNPVKWFEQKVKAIQPVHF